MAAYSKEGQALIDDAVNCLFNAFDIDRVGRLSFRNLSSGLDILCYTDGAADSEPLRLGGHSEQPPAKTQSTEVLKSGTPARAVKDEPVAMKKTRQSKQEREKLTAKSGSSVMEK